jgi:two-component system response regulator HydG
LVLPPLRRADRRNDVPLLAEFFLGHSEITGRRKIRGFRKLAIEKLLSHDWPGNVRELQNVVDRAMILESSDQIGPESIVLDADCGAATAPAEHALPARSEAEPSPNDPKQFSLETAEREFILRALKETGWQRTQAASLLGITRATLHAKLKRYDIQAPGANAGTSRLEEAMAAQ